MAHVVVIGGGLGGLPTAYELRHYLPKKHTVTLVSDRPQFTFIPGLIRVALNLNPLKHIQLELNQLTRRHGIEWIPGKVIAIAPETQQITVEGNQNINYDYVAIANAKITHIDAQTITLANGFQLPFKYSMILPSFRGAKFLPAVPGLTNKNGFIPVLPSQRHPNFPNLYALGVSVQLEQPEPTPIAISVPKSGQMAEAMGVAVAHNIAVKLGAINSPLTAPTLEVVCFAEYGNTGIAYIAAPVLPDPNTGKRRYSYAVRGRWVNWVKAAFEKYFLLKMRWGLGMPWFEKLGLRVLFGLSMFQSDVKLGFCHKVPS